MIVDALVTLLGWFEVLVWFLAKAKGFGVVLGVALTLLAVAVGAVVANGCRSLWRRVIRKTHNEGDLQ